MIYRTLDEIPPLAYDVILADPPTDFETWSDKGHGKSQHAHYDVMSWEALEALNVGYLGRGDAILMCWGCWPTIDRTLSMIRAWGFKYVTGGAWTKLTKYGKHRWGTGYRLRSITEPYLIATLGSPETIRTVKNIIETKYLSTIRAENLGHSRKPDEQYEVCERIMPRAIRYLELFARKTRPGWDSHGNEVGKFDATDSAGGGHGATA